MNQIELLRHVADNLEAGIATCSGLQRNGRSVTHINLPNSDEYTLAPRTHTVNSFVVPAPLTEPPAMGTAYFIASPLTDAYFNHSNWDGYKLDLKYLNRGAVHLTKEAAQQNALAMLGKDPVKGVDGV